MTFNERFEEEEIFLLQNTPYLVGAAMIFAEGSGLGTIKEFYSNAKTYIEGAKSFPENKIIEGILPNMTDWSQMREQTKAFQEKSMEIFKSKGISSSQEMRQFALEEAQKANTLLTQKANEQETKEYKHWVMSIAQNVANAAKEGGFLGFGGERLSENEKEFYTNLAKIMGGDTTLV